MCWENSLRHITYFNEDEEQRNFRNDGPVEMFLSGLGAVFRI